MDFYLKMKRFFWEGFGVEECGTAAMRRAVPEWFELFYRGGILALPWAIVRKVNRAVFAEFACRGAEPEGAVIRKLLEEAMIGGEAFLKQGDLGWEVLPRNRVLVFDRDANGNPTDVGLVGCHGKEGRDWFTLLERRQRDGDGRLHVCNRLFRSRSQSELGREIPLSNRFPELPGQFVYDGIPGVGLVSLKMPMANCVDGSAEGVSFFAPAANLIRLAEENEAQLCREFENGRSRLVVSRDMLRDGLLRDDLFVGLDEAPETVGITVFAPEIRHECYLARQQSYLRSIENVVGLKRGLLSQVEAVDRTATEVTSSEGEYMTTILELQAVAEKAVREAAALRCLLEGTEEEEVSLSWGDGVV